MVISQALWIPFLCSISVISVVTSGLMTVFMGTFRLDKTQSLFKGISGSCRWIFVSSSLYLGFMVCHILIGSRVPSRTILMAFSGTELIFAWLALEFRQSLMPEKSKKKGLNIIFVGCILIGFFTFLISAALYIPTGTSPILGNTVLGLFAMIQLLFPLIAIVEATTIISETTDPIKKRFFYSSLITNTLFIPFFIIDVLLLKYYLTTGMLPAPFFTCIYFAVITTRLLILGVLYLMRKPSSTLSISFPEGYISCLTSREKEVLEHLMRGKSALDVATKTYVSLPTAKTHIQNIYRKLGVGSRYELLSLAMTDKSMIPIDKQKTLSVS